MPMEFGHGIRAYFSIMPNNGLFMEAIKSKGRFHGKKKNDEISQYFIHNYIHWQVLETEDRRLDTGSILAADKFKLSPQFISAWDHPKYVCQIMLVAPSNTSFVCRSWRQNLLQ